MCDYRRWKRTERIMRSVSVKYDYRCEVGCGLLQSTKSEVTIQP
jgi:hypothetical protein